MSSPKVLVIGCGIAGPVIACLLKQKMYHPIIFEKADSPGDVGASLLLAPNGLKVLSQLGPVTDRFLHNGPPIGELCDYVASGQVLGQSELPSQFAEKYGQPCVGITRTLITSWVRGYAAEMGIEIRDGWTLSGITESQDSVTAIFDNGLAETGSFLVGCDGLRSTSRRLLLNRQDVEDGQPSFTGLTQTAGFSPTPKAFLDHPTVRNWYGELSHVICYPLSHSHVAWALTLPDDVGSEASWGLFDAQRMASTKDNLKMRLDAHGWDPTVQELVTSAERLIKYGIFDRPGLSADQWFSGRCVLLGDAAHPSSVHLGQGANQSCEDCHYLSQNIPVFDPTQLLTTCQLTAIFRTFAEKQQPHTAALTATARKLGSARVVPAEACAQRDAAIKNRFLDNFGLQAGFDSTFSRPF
ncbi:hypothetical protein QQS21_006230 [Conoideocrella luteorostrata]|uniref:FAD-binding domain-containing protein n=1 Tax=Conoideocrella luteorostrata TaxID=1105319 RepID=A0AAJ0FY82_9HYPO|nr:hypothetical protein QQS21_006230 [Conoideocrella luteorostrata]